MTFDYKRLADALAEVNRACQGEPHNLRDVTPEGDRAERLLVNLLLEFNEASYSYERLLKYIHDRVRANNYGAAREAAQVLLYRLSR